MKDCGLVLKHLTQLDNNLGIARREDKISEDVELHWDLHANFLYAYLRSVNQLIEQHEVKVMDI